MKAALRFILAAAILLLALPAFELAAAPGSLFTPIGPFGEMDAGVQDLLFPAAAKDRMLIRTREDVLISRDGGASWRSVLAHEPRIEPQGLVADPLDSDRWYVTEGSEELDGRVWMTADAGRSWSPMSLPAAEEDPGAYRELFLHVDAFEPTRLAVEIFSRATGGYRSYLSANRGRTWTEIPDDAGSYSSRLLGINDGFVYFRSGRYDVRTGQLATINLVRASQIVFDRVRRNTLYVMLELGSLVNVYSSIDRGENLVLLRSSPELFTFFIQSPWNPSHLAMNDSDGLALSLDRGQTWTVQPALLPLDGAFDPGSGELLLASAGLQRRRLDGTTSAIPIVGLSAAEIREVAAMGDRAAAVDSHDDFHLRDRQGVWQRRGRIEAEVGGFRQGCQGEVRVLLAPDDPSLAAAICPYATFTSRDGGWTWSYSTGFGSLVGPYQLRSSGRTLYCLRGGDIIRSADFGASSERIGLGNYSGIALDPSGDLLAVRSDGLISRYFPTFGWQTPGNSLPGNTSASNFPPYLVSDEAHPGLVYGIRGTLLSRSLDFGYSWQTVADLNAAVPGGWSFVYWPHLEVIIDPSDRDHWIILGLGFETRDGGLSFTRLSETEHGTASFDPLAPGRLLAANEASNGVLERTTRLVDCPESERAWCARDGRFLLTVEWRDPQGRRGRAEQVASGSEGSGIFFFFDEDNWELLVKVLDGCAINQRRWLFAAGTTDVEYTLQVEDRWTGQIRHYYNVAGRAAPAITDIDAFSGCATPPPPGAALAPPATAAAGDGAGEPVLRLLDDRFEVTTRWTDFAGQEGDGLTAGLRSDSSGLFYFFSRDNWEMLVKVLDGCAINGNYWVLSAATTDVGYQLRVRDTAGNRTKTYRNPVGLAAPAQIDIEAFTCP